MKLVNMLVSISCVLFLSSCDRHPFSQILTISSLAQATDALAAADNKPLIVFDVDETLIMPADAIWQQGRIWEGNVTKHFSLSDEIKNAFKDCKDGDLDDISDRMLNVKFEPVEKITTSFVTELQHRNLKIIALTNFGPGEFGHIPSLKKWRKQQLAMNGIDFGSSFPALSLTFNNLSATQSGHPEFYQGILFGANNPKGVVLTTFIDKIDFIPTKVIVIDDKEKYLLSIQEELAKRSIPFQGFLYTGAEKEAASIDVAVIEYQLDCVQKKHEFVTDRQAYAQLNKHMIYA